jgi:hypothetical protein
MCIKYESETGGYLDITIGHRWDYIPMTRSYVEKFLNSNITDKLRVMKIIVSISELLENAVKYSYKEGVRAKIKRDAVNHKLELTVYNYATKEESFKLIEYIKEIDNNKDPLKFYLDKMKDAVKNKKNGLGLPRIKYEGEANISANYFEEETGDGTVRVKAVFNI